jgi:23S rRNA (uracil1939-C5)-methyltransferase
VERGQEITLEVQDAVFEGKGIARCEGFVVFVNHTVPGDIVAARILKKKKNYAEARMVRLERPSPLRVEPRCKYFGVCGGCTWQHAGYKAQLRFKQQHVVDSFERIGGFADLDVHPIIGSDDIFFYRSKMEYSFSERQWKSTPPEIVENENDDEIQRSPSDAPAEGGRHPVFLGLHVPQRYDKVLDIDECYLQSPLSNRILNFTRRFARQNGLRVYDSRTETGYLRFLVIRESKSTGEVMANLVTYRKDEEIMGRFTDQLRIECPEISTVVNTINSRKAQVAFGETEDVYYGDGFIREKLGGAGLIVSANSFFQTNVAQAARLYGVARDFGEFKPTDVVFDLYSGTGSIAIFLSDAVKEIVGIEAVESAVRDAERNVRENGIANCSFVLGDLKDRLSKDTDWMSSRPKPNALVIDPPRSGMHPKVVDEIVALAPERIVYVSCNPSTQARDVRALCSERYRLSKLQPVDMFPHTYHVENVALLLRRDG